MSLFEVVDPATEAVIERLPAATAADADAAVARAAAAFEGWRAVAPADRSRLLRRLAERLDAERERLAQLEMRNTGKPIGDARAEMGMVADTFAYYAGAPERLLGDTIPVAGGVDLTFREPLGVVGLITPWNFPLVIASWKLAPALAAIIAAGLHGVDKGLALEDEFTGNAYVADKPSVPRTLREARELFTGSAIARQAFGDEVVDHYVNAADVELAAFDSAVTDWERYRGFERL